MWNYKDNTDHSLQLFVVKTVNCEVGIRTMYINTECKLYSLLFCVQNEIGCNSEMKYPGNHDCLFA